MELADKIEAFRALLEADSLADLAAGMHDCEANRARCAGKIKMGRKYCNVDLLECGKYMVELSTERIFGIKAYGVIHRGHQYGTLDTIKEWNWGPFYAVKRPTLAA